MDSGNRVRRGGFMLYVINCSLICEISRYISVMRCGCSFVCPLPFVLCPSSIENSML